MRHWIFAFAGLCLLILSVGLRLSSDQASASASAKITIATLTDTPTPDCGLAWRVVSSPNPSMNANRFYGVAAVSANDVWAVGSEDLIEHWNGSSWSNVPSPNVGVLYGVSAVSANDVWAVGASITVHWDGSAWSIVPSPSAGELHGVAAVSANDVWAVGYYGNATLVEHWNGSSWTVVPSPNPGTQGSNNLRGVVAVSANDVWAVGLYFDYPSSYEYKTLVEHWDGASWSVVLSPNPGANADDLRGVAALSANDVWAVGYSIDTGNIYQTLVEHWDGASWSVVPSPNVGTNEIHLIGVAAVSVTDVWAVGEYYSTGSGPYQTFTEHWDGISWSVILSPNVGPGYYSDFLNGVAAVSANDIWAVGYFNGISQQTLVEHYNDLCTPYLVAHVTWQGPPPQPDTRQQLPITLTLKSGATEVNYPGQNTDASGTFTVSVAGLANGTYNWRVKGPKYLAKVGTVALTGSPTTNAEMGFMLTGDCDNNNVVNATDFSILRGTFGKGIGDPGYDDRADFTGDQAVNINDFNLLRSNFGVAGAPPISPRGK